MPVDLSRIGLEGIETSQRTLNSMANREALASQTAIAEAEEARTAEDREIDQWAAGALDSIGRGDGVPGAGGDISLGDDDDPASVFDAIGQRYLRAGAPKKGKEFIEGGMDLRKKRADLAKVQDDKEKVRLDNMFSAGSWVAQNIGENESEYAVFLSQLEDPNNPVGAIIGEENVALLKNTPWSPELVNYFKSKALSIKDQASLALTERGHRRAEQSLSDTEAYRARLLEISQGNLEARNREARVKAKADGPDVSKAPTADERKTAQRSIITNVKALGGAMPKEGTPEYDAVLNMTDDIVGRVKVILKENKGLTFPEATEQAVAEAELAGDFKILQPAETVPWYMPGDDKPAKVGYKRKGSRPDNPIALPTGDAATVKKRLVKGRYYQTPMGTLKWNGTAFDQ